MDKNILLERSQIEDKYKWDIKSLYKDIEHWERDAKKLEEKSNKLLSYKGRLGESPKVLYEALWARDDLFRLADNLYTYTSLLLDQDTRDGESQALSDKAFNLYLKASEEASFLYPELLDLEEDKIRNFLNENEELKLYSQFLNEILRKKNHILSAREEEIMARVGEITSSPENVYSMLNNADLKFPTIKNESGADIEITHGNFIPLMESKDREVRKNAFKSLYKTYKGLENTFASLLDGEIKSNKFNANMRRYKNSMEASLDGNNIDVKVYENLLNSIHDNLKPMHEYISIRKKALNLDNHHMYDLYTPIVEDIDYKFSFEEAKDVIRKGLEPLGKEYIKILDDGFENGWIDVYENKGKRSGGYSGGSYDSKPFILLNYKDTMDSMFTMAHEMGHSIHSYLSRENQSYIYSNYGIFVAEIASTVNEVLLINYMLSKAETKEERKYLLNHQLDSFRTTVYRQTMFAEFEKDINDHVAQGGALTADFLNKSYKELNTIYYGPEMIVDDEVEIEWARIPHFYYNFYVYQYATGYSIAVSIVDKILKKEEGIVDKYIKFLSSGSSDYPLNILKDLGIDVKTREPIDKALDYFNDLLGEVKKLI